MLRSGDVMVARRATVQEHVRRENLHDVDGIMQTFGTDARYDDDPWDDHRVGRNAVRRYYEELMHAVPDLVIEIQNEHVTDKTIVLEVLIRGTHTGAWRGLPGTGRHIGVPLCAIYTFDESNQIASERIYYDRAGVLAQLGVFHDPRTLIGRALGSVTHPVTVLRVVWRKLVQRWR